MPFFRSPSRPLTRIASPLTITLLLALAGGLTACVGPTPASGVEYLQRARSHQQQGDIQAALVEARNARQLAPEDDRIQLLLGQLYLEAGQFAEAEKALRLARSLNPRGRDWRVPMSRVYLAQGQARRLLDELPTEDIYDPLETRAALLALRGQAHLDLAEFEAARRLLDQALALIPDHTEARFSLASLDFHQGRLEYAQERVAGLLAEDGDQPRVLFLLGRIAQERGDPAAALAAYDRALAFWPRYPALELARAEVLLAQGQYDQALVGIRGLKDRLPLPALYLEAVVAVLKGEDERARDLLERILTASPEHVQSRYLVGMVYHRLGLTRRAEVELTAVVNARPDFLRARKLLGAVQLQLEAPERAVRTLEPAVGGARDDRQLLSLLGSAWLGQGQYDRGIHYLKAAAALTPRAGELHGQLALSYLKAGEADQAARLLDQTLDLGGEVVELDVLRILTWLQQGQVREALTAAQAMTEGHPGLVQGWNLLGLARIAAGDHDQARLALERALELSPEDDTALLNLAHLDRLAGNDSSAGQRYRRLLDNQPDHLEALLALAALRAGGDARGWLERAWQAHPGEARAGLALAREYFQWDEPERAWQVVQTLEGAHRGNGELMTALGRLLLDQDQPREAAARLLGATGLDRTRAEPWYWLARARQAAGDDQGALLAAREVLTLQADHQPALALAARLALAEGEVEEAHRHADAWLKATPGEMAPRQLLAHIELQRGRPEAAVAIFSRAGSLDLLDEWLADQPQDHQARRQRAILHQLQGDLAAAAADYRQLLQDSPDDPVLLNELAWLYNGLNDPRALTTARRAYGLAPDRAEIADTLGLILVGNGQVQEGLALLERAARQVPEVAVVHYHLAMGYQLNDQPGRARQVLERLLTDFPDFAEADQARSLLEQLQGRTDPG